VRLRFLVENVPSRTMLSLLRQLLVYKPEPPSLFTSMSPVCSRGRERVVFSVSKLDCLLARLFFFHFRPRSEGSSAVDRANDIEFFHVLP